MHLVASGVVVSQLHQATAGAQLYRQPVAYLGGAHRNVGGWEVVGRWDIAEVEHLQRPAFAASTTLIHGTIPSCALKTPTLLTFSS